jgi:hypothetical protein
MRLFEAADWPAVWAILEPAFRAGDSYPCAVDISEAEARRYWIETPPYTFVALDDAGAIVGTYYLRPDQMGSARMSAIAAMSSPNRRAAAVSPSRCAAARRKKRAAAAFSA